MPDSMIIFLPLRGYTGRGAQPHCARLNKDRGINKCRLSFRESCGFRGAKGNTVEVIASPILGQCLLRRRHLGLVILWSWVKSGELASASTDLV